MPGSRLGLDDVARRLSFSPASTPPPRKHSSFRVVPDLSPIAEDPREQQQAAAAAATPQPPPWVSSPSPAPHTATYLPPVSPSPVHTQIVPASRAPPSQTQQQRLAAALGKLEHTRQAGLQQAAATSPPPPWVSSPFSAATHTVNSESPATSLPPVSPSPVHAQIVPASPAPPSQAQQQQQIAAALEQARQAGLQQAWAAAQQQIAAALGKLEQARQAGLQQAWAAAQQQQALASAFRGWDQRRQAAPQPHQAVGLLPGSQQAFAQPYLEPPQQLRLYTVDGEPAGYKTKWEELHPVSQQLLLQIEDKIREERQLSEQLDQCSHLCDPSVSNNSFERDARQITQEIGSISTIMDREKASVHSLMDVVKETISTVEFAIGSYVKLRPLFVSKDGFANHAGSSAARTNFSQPLTMGRTLQSSHGSVRRPSIFMQHLVDRFEKQLEECCKLIGELEQLVQMMNNKTYPPSLESLPKVMSNTHDYFIYVASKVENLHQCAETIRIHHLNDLRNSGNRNDPFSEADRKEAAKQQAAARIVHPTLPIGDTGSRRRMCN